MKPAPMRLRLLPAVLIAGAALLAFKGAGLVRNAQAQEQSVTRKAPAEAKNAIARSRTGPDDTGDVSSAAEADVLTGLARRRAELDARARDQAMRENILAATEKRVDGKISQLKQLQTQITALLGQRDAAQAKQMSSLVKTYSAMKPKDAARIFNGLNEEVLIAVADEMKSDALAPILAAMNAEAAEKLTLKLASRLALPATASIGSAADEKQAAPAPAPAQQAQSGAPALEASTPQSDAAAAEQAPRHAAAPTSNASPGQTPPVPPTAAPMAPDSHG